MLFSIFPEFLNRQIVGEDRDSPWSPLPSSSPGVGDGVFTLHCLFCG